MTKAEKDSNFRRLNKMIYRIAENGTWKDWVAWNVDFNKACAANELLKGDQKILVNGATYAEKQIRFHKRFN